MNGWPKKPHRVEEFAGKKKLLFCKKKWFPWLNLGDLLLRSTLGLSDDRGQTVGGWCGGPSFLLDTHVAPILVGFIYPFSRNLNAYIYI